MNIKFDYELEDRYKGFTPNVEAKVYLDEIKKEVIERLNSISDIIESEENEAYKNGGLSLVYIRVMTNNFRIYCIDYTKAVSDVVEPLLDGLMTTLVPKWELARQRLFN